MTQSAEDSYVFHPQIKFPECMQCRLALTWDIYDEPTIASQNDDDVLLKHAQADCACGLSWVVVTDEDWRELRVLGVQFDDDD
jgi:hypothetical protein